MANGTPGVEIQVEGATTTQDNDNMLYKVSDSPPWYLSILLGFQHYLTAFGSTLTVPLVLQSAMCIVDDRVGLSEIISTSFFVSGLSTLLQTTLGVRLPIIQGPTFFFLTPTFTILALKKWECPYNLAAKGEWNVTSDPLPDPGSPEHQEIWQMRMREIQGAIMVSSLFEIVIGFSGVIGLFLHFIGPLVIVPTISLIGLSLFKEAADLASKQWYIAVMTMVLIAIYSQYLKNVKIPVCRVTRRDGCSMYKLPLFKLFPILLALISAWVICGILTAASAFPEQGKWGSDARTDTKVDVLEKALWFRFPYPGAIMVSSLFEIVIGFSGVIGLFLHFIGPLVIVPTISLIGLSLFKEAADLASKQWYIAVMTMVLIAIYSQYLKNVKIPVCRVTRRDGCSMYKLPLFKLFPILLALISAWVICGILTAASAFPEQGKWGSDARTDTKVDVLEKALWFRFPYPGQWGLPTVSVSAVFGMLAGVLASIIESVGDYYACAKLAGAPPPPVHAINRGIGMEGIGCLLAGAWGSGNGMTSYSENIGAIGITRVGSRRVVQMGGLIMMIMGCLGKFGALFVTIPDPVIGGLFMVVFGMVVAVGLSNLQFVDLSSSRNIFIIGTSIFFGLSFPNWMKTHPGYIDTGSDIVDQMLSVLLGTSMFVGGLTGFVLDNTIPGTLEERGILRWRQKDGSVTTSKERNDSVYDLPCIQKYLNKLTITQYLPFCPNFQPCCGKGTSKKDKPPVEPVSVYEKKVEDTHM